MIGVGLIRRLEVPNQCTGLKKKLTRMFRRALRKFIKAIFCYLAVYKNRFGDEKVELFDTTLRHGHMSDMTLHRIIFESFKCGAWTHSKRISAVSLCGSSERSGFGFEV